MPADITSIDYNAFYCCDNLADVYFCGTERAWKNILIEAGNEHLTQANIHFHKWNDWVITKKATCDAEGVMTNICSVCGTKQIKQIPKTDHTNKTAMSKAAIGKNGSIITKCTLFHNQAEGNEPFCTDCKIKGLYGKLEEADNADGGLSDTVQHLIKFQECKDRNRIKQQDYEQDNFKA